MGKQTISKEALDKIAKSVRSENPEFQKVAPKVVSAQDNRFTLVFEKKVKTEDGLTMNLSLRVTVDSAGKILSKSVSR